jgi:hypothetical protein
VSLLPDAGTEFDDGDVNPNTKSYCVCGSTSGVVTITSEKVIFNTFLILGYL